MKISEDIRRGIIQNMASFCKSVRKIDPEEALSFIVADKYLASQARYFAAAFARNRLDPRSSRILEVGCGYGLFLCQARSVLGWNIWGIEPG